jgi:hypothetical protein
MRFILTAIFAAIAYALYPSGVFHIPFAQLTLGNIFSLIGAVIFAVMAIAALFEQT